MTPVQKLQSLIKFLPANDIIYARKFIEKRDFSSLREIVLSDIRKHYRKVNRGIPDSSTEDTLEVLKDLLSEIESYLRLLGDIDY